MFYLAGKGTVRRQTVLGPLGEVALRGCLAPYFIHGCVLRHNWEWARSLAGKQPHTWSQDALLYRTDDSAHLFFSKQTFFRPPQTLRKGIHQRKLLYPSPQQSNPCTYCRISIRPWCFYWREVASLLPFLTLGHLPKVFALLCMQMYSHLPAAIPERALHWRWPDPAAKSALAIIVLARLSWAPK